MKRIVKIGCLMLVATLFLNSVWAQKDIQDPKLIKGELKNGLTYYIYPNTFPKGETVYRLFIKSGSVLENEKQRGLAHFLEHMAFNGTVHFPADSLIRYLESSGAKFGKDLNAHTSYNETVYKLQLPSNDKGLVDRTMTILADWAGGLLLDSAEIEQERGVIMSEWLSNKKGNEAVQNAFLSKLLNGSRFAERKVIGDTAVIKNFKRQEIVDYYSKWYDPQFMAIAVVGDVDAVEIQRMVKEKFGGLQAQKGNKIPVYGIKNYKTRSFETIIDPSESKIELNLIQLFEKDKPINKQRDYEGYLKRNLLNQLIKKRFANLTFDNPAYIKAGLQSSGFLNTKKIVLASVEINPEKPDASISDFALHLEQMLQKGFLKTEIEAVKESYGKALQRKAERKTPVSSANLMDELYNDFYRNQRMVSTDAEYQWYQASEPKIDSLSLLKELRAMYRPDKVQYQLSGYPKVELKLPSQDRVYALFDSLKNVDLPAYYLAVEKHDQLLEKMPEKGLILNKSYIKELDATVLELSNGTKVVLKKPQVKDSRLTISAYRKGGLYALDSVDYLTGQYATNVVALSGAGTFSRESLSHYLNGKSASVRFLVDKTRAGIAGSADLKQAETLFQLLYLKWTAPKVDSKNFALIKEKANESFRTTLKTDVTRFQSDLSDILNGKDYTTREVTETVVDKYLQESSVIPVFNKMYGNANGYTFVISADMDEAALEDLILRYVAALPSGNVDTNYVYQRPALVNQHVRFSREASDSPKATVSLITQEDYIREQIDVYNLKSDILAAIIRMKLQEKLREQMGMIYSVGVSASAIPYPSPLSRQSISFNCDPVNVDTLISATHEVLRKIANDPGFIEKELMDIKSNQLKEMELNKQKDSYWSSYIRNTLFNSIGNWSYVQDFNQIIANISAEDIAKLCHQDYLKAPLAVQAVMLPKKKDNK